MDDLKGIRDFIGEVTPDMAEMVQVEIEEKPKEVNLCNHMIKKNLMDKELVLVVAESNLLG